jgi:hypothetical protein
MAKRTLSYEVGDPNYLKVLLLQEILKTCELIHLMLRREETGKMVMNTVTSEYKKIVPTKKGDVEIWMGHIRSPISVLLLFLFY